MTNRPTEELITCVEDFLKAEFNGAVAAFNGSLPDSTTIQTVAWGDGFGDLLNAMKLPAGDVSCFEITASDEGGRVMASGDVDIAVRASISDTTAKKVLTRYADLLWQLVESHPSLGGRCLLAQWVNAAFGISSEQRGSGFVLVTINVTVELEV